MTRFFESKIGLVIVSPLLGLLGGLAALIAQPVFEPYIEREKVDYTMLFDKQAEAFDALARSYGNLAVHDMPDDRIDQRYKDILGDLKVRAEAEGERDWRRARVLIATYGHPDQVRALNDYILTRWQKRSCEPYIARDVQIYQVFRSQLFRGKDQFENEEEERKLLALVVHDCNLNPTSTANAS